MDRQIKHMGHRVELDEIESAISTIDGVTENAVLYDKNKEQLVMIYVGKIDKKSIIIELRKLLPDFMIPRRIIDVDDIPKLPNGKKDLKKLEDEML